jgi:hypothetical protein
MLIADKIINLQSGKLQTIKSKNKKIIKELFKNGRSIDFQRPPGRFQIIDRSIETFNPLIIASLIPY